MDKEFSVKTFHIQSLEKSSGGILKSVKNLGNLGTFSEVIAVNVHWCIVGCIHSVCCSEKRFRPKVTLKQGSLTLKAALSPKAAGIRTLLNDTDVLDLQPYRWHCPGESIHRQARPHCWSVGSCGPASWPPPLWPRCCSFGPAAEPWLCSTSCVRPWLAGGCTEPAAPLLLRRNTKEHSVTENGVLISRFRSL